MIATHPATPKRFRPRFVSFDTMREVAAKESSGWLVEGVLREGGLCMFVGRPREGKTTVLIAMCAAIAAGRLFVGLPTKRKKILWISEEHMVTDLVETVDSVCAGLGLKHVPSKFRFQATRGFSLDDDESVERMRRHLDEREIGIVVIDTLRRVTRRDENRSDDASAVRAAAARLTSNGTRLVVLIHHTDKAASDGRPRGSGDLDGGFDTTISVKRDANSSVLDLKASHHGPPQRRLQLVYDRDVDVPRKPIAYRLEAPAAKGKKKAASGIRQKQVLDALRGVSMSVSDLRSAVGAGHNQDFTSLMQRLVGDGEVTQQTVGKKTMYSLP